jgi:adenylyltransferase/sulfurtransferase
MMMQTNTGSERYRRQIAVVGEDGQDALSKARIVIAGAGGLGSAIALYCAAAGIGHIRLIDCDTVEVSNLNRQILYRTDDIGKEKVTAAAADLVALNPDIGVEPVRMNITEENAESLLDGADLVLDGLDNFPARYLLAHAAWKRKIPFIHGAVSGMYGQVTTIIPGVTPCLRCMVPFPPPSDAIPILGATTGIIGSIQAAEAIKYLMRRGVLFTGRMLLWDGLRGDTSVITIEHDPSCRECGGSANE